MAFVRRSYTDQEGQGDQGLYSEGGSGVAGTAQTQASSGTQQTQSKAATPGSWYNVQDFLKVNEAAIPGMQEGLKDRAQNLIGQDKQKADTAISTMSGISRPEALGFDENLARTGSQDDVYKGLTQTQDFSPTDYNQFNFTQNEKLTGLKPGDFQSVSTFNTDTQTNRPGYTMGMGKMNDLLLGQDAGFTENFAPWTQNQYSEQVTNPLIQGVTEAQQKDAATQEGLGQAQQGWWSGVQGILGADQQRVQDAAAAQKAEHEGITTQDPLSLLSAGIKDLGGLSAKSPLTGKTYVDWNKYLTKHGGDYATLNEFAPTQETAALSALGDEGIGRFNMLSDFMGNLGAEQDYGNLSGQDWQAPSWDLNAQGLKDNYTRANITSELNQDIIPALEQHGQTLAETQKAVKGYDAEIAKLEKERDAAMKADPMTGSFVLDDWEWKIGNLTAQRKHWADRAAMYKKSYDKTLKRRNEITSILNA